MLHVHRFGPREGPPLLALHGVAGHGARFARLAVDALPGFQVLAPDLRGHGTSPWTPPWRFEQHVRDLIGVLDSAGVERVSLLGHSFGGAVAVYLAIAVPQRVRKLVLLDPAIGIDPVEALHAAREAMHSPSFGSRSQARDSKAAAWPESPDWALDAEVAQHLEPGDDRRWRWRYCPAAEVTAWSEMARPHEVPPRGMPTLLVPALRAEYVTAAFVEDCRTALEEYLTIREVDCGHQLYLDAADEVGALVAEFLQA